MFKFIGFTAVAVFLATSPLRAQIITDDYFLQSVSPLVQTDPQTAVFVEAPDGSQATTTLGVLNAKLTGFHPGIYLIVYVANGKVQESEVLVD